MVRGGTVRRHNWGWRVNRWRRTVKRFFFSDHVEIVLGIIFHESRGTRRAVNKTSGAMGLLQHLPPYWADRSRAAGWGGWSAFNGEANIAVAAWLLYDGWHPETAPNWQHWAATYRQALADLEEEQQ